VSRRAIALLALAAMGMALAGCGGGEAKRRNDLTERQRDSVIATEKALPGSGVVGRALATSDSAAARSQRMDQAAGESGDAAGEGK
jgi:hypothetical protein